MSKSTSGAPKRVAAGLLAGALSVFGLALTATPAGATADAQSARIGGADRYATAADICDQVAPKGAANVLLASGDAPWDALTGSSLAGERNTCILLTPKGALDNDTAAQITQMKGLATPLTSVTILGGVDAVSAATETAVKDLGVTTDRIQGATRIETAAEIAKTVDVAGTLDGGRTAIIANGYVAGGADALSVGPEAARGDGTNPFPVLLVATDSVPAATTKALNDRSIDNVIILGGINAISESTATTVATTAGDTTPTRLFGDMREDTAVKIAEYAQSKLGFNVAEVLLANSGRNIGFSPDALAGGPLGDVRSAPIVLSQTADSVGNSTLAYLDAHSNTIAKVTALGGTLAISESALTAALNAVKTVSNDTNQSFTVTPAGAQSNTADSTAGPASAVSFTVTGLDNAKKYDIALVPCANVTANGQTITFKDADGTAGAGDNLADNIDSDDTDTPANIETVNSGSAIGGEYVDAVSPVNGAITFTVDSAQETCVVGVVFNDANGDNALNLNAANQPTEAFVVTGPITFTAPAAKAGPVGDATLGANVSSVNKAADQFTGCVITAADPEASDPANCAVYTYDANDTFTVGSTAGQSLAQFEAALSPGDDVSGTYNTDPAGISNFILTDEAPTAPGLTAANTSGSESTSNTLTITAPTEGTADTYNVYRAVTCAAITDGATTGATKVASIPGTQTKYVDSGLTPSTDYCYVVTAVSSGDESAPSGEVESATQATNQADEDAPTVLDVRAIDNGLVNTADAGDVHRFIFSEAMSPTADDAGANYAVVSSEFGIPATGNIVCGSNGTTCVLNAAPVTINTVTYAANTVLTVTLGTVTGTGYLGGSAPLTYPLTVTGFSAQVKDVAGNVATTGGDNQIEPAPFTGGPAPV